MGILLLSSQSGEPTEAMAYVLGIESGGTKTIAQLARLDGGIVSRTTGPSIADVVANPEAARAGLQNILVQLKQFPATGEIRAVYASLGGLNLATIVEVTRELLPGVAVEAHRESSGDVIFACAPWWGFDLALMVGTGTVALACTPRRPASQNRRLGLLDRRSRQRLRYRARGPARRHPPA